MEAELGALASLCADFLVMLSQVLSTAASLAAHVTLLLAERRRECQAQQLSKASINSRASL